MRIASFIVMVIGTLLGSVSTLVALAIVLLTFVGGSEGHVRAAAEPQVWQLRLVAGLILVVGVCLAGGLYAAGVIMWRRAARPVGKSILDNGS